jgi:hypothetical protein
MIFIFLIPTAIFIGFLPDLFRTIQAEAKLFSELHQNHRALWERLGQPISYFWRPPGFTMAFPDMKLSFGMLRKQEPVWIDEAPELKDLYYACRAGTRRWAFIAMPLFGVALLVCICLKMFL